MKFIYLAFICLSLPFYLIWVEIKDRKKIVNQVGLKNVDESYLLNEKQYQVKDSFMNIFNEEFKDWSVWIDSKDNLFDIREEFKNKNKH